MRRRRLATRGGGYLPPPSTPAQATQQHHSTEGLPTVCMRRPTRATPCASVCRPRARAGVLPGRGARESPNLWWPLDERPDSMGSAAAKGVGWDRQRRGCLPHALPIGCQHLWMSQVVKIGKNFTSRRALGEAAARRGADRLPSRAAATPCRGSHAHAHLRARRRRARPFQTAVHGSKEISNPATLHSATRVQPHSVEAAKPLTPHTHEFMDPSSRRSGPDRHLKI